MACIAAMLVSHAIRGPGTTHDNSQSRRQTPGPQGRPSAVHDPTTKGRAILFPAEANFFAATPIEIISELVHQPGMRRSAG